MKERKETTRRCVGCGESKDKRVLIRVVRTPEGHIELDPTGKANGRGAYVCSDSACFEAARKRHRFDSSLKVSLKDDDYDRLRRDFDAIPPNETQ